ncbi:MAG TPA: ankyrin repeat domain-containing protein [Edaphobacter sp.]|nr:ankyrin repeat domain-containing protein [Edaphobacter sp.]
MSRSYLLQFGTVLIAATLSTVASAIGETHSSLVTTAHSSVDSGELLQAAESDDIDAVRNLLRQHVNLNAAAGDGMTALHWAAYNDDTALTKLLIDAGAMTEARTRVGGITPLILAAENGDADLLKVLLDGRAQANTANNNGTTPLMEAAAAGSAAAMQVLLDHGATVNAREKTYGQTALIFAVSHNRVAAVRLLLQNGAESSVKTTVTKLARVSVGVDGDALTDVNKPNEQAATAKNEEKKTVTDTQVITPGTTSNSKKDSSDAPAEKPRAKDELTSNGGKNTSSSGKKSASVKETNGSAKKKDEADAYGFTAEDRRNRVYGSLSLGGLNALHIAARDGQIDAAKALLAAHMDINAITDTDHATALILALINGHFDLARLLLSKGADTKLVTTDGLGPLYALVDVQWAPHTWYPQPVISQEHTPYLELLAELLEHQAEPNIQLSRKLWFRVFANDETWVEAVGATPFWRAALAGDLASMRILIDHGADPKLATKSGDTPLMVAAGLGWAAYWTSNAPSPRIEAVKFCLAHGGEVNTKDAKSYTALHGAAFRGDDALVKLLLANGADIHATTKMGDTVTDAANGLFEHALTHPQTVAMLESLGAKNSNNCRSNECVVPAKEDKVVATATKHPANEAQTQTDTHTPPIGGRK